MKHTGVFATKAEIAEMQKAANTASNTPMIAMSSEAALSGRDESSLAWNRVYDLVNRTAKKHKLPDIKGNYGLSEKGEFLTE